LKTYIPFLTISKSDRGQDYVIIKLHVPIFKVTFA
jgi:hypothetical protein